MSDNPYASPRASGTPAQRRAGPRLIAAIRACFYVLGAMGLILDGMAWYTFLTRRIDVLWWLGTLGALLSGACLLFALAVPAWRSPSALAAYVLIVACLLIVVWIELMY